MHCIHPCRLRADVLALHAGTYYQAHAKHQRASASCTYLHSCTNLHMSKNITHQEHHLPKTCFQCVNLSRPSCTLKKTEGQSKHDASRRTLVQERLTLRLTATALLGCQMQDRRSSPGKTYMHQIWTRLQLPEVGSNSTCTQCNMLCLHTFLTHVHHTSAACWS